MVLDFCKHLTSQQKLLEVHEGGLEGKNEQQGTGKGYSDQADESDNLDLDGQSISFNFQEEGRLIIPG